MPHLKFVYFNGKALGESSRMLMAYGGLEFEDVRVSWKDWAEIKPNYPFGELPVLEVGGKQYAQSRAIARYLGRRVGLAGADDDDEAAMEVDMCVDFLYDIEKQAESIFYEEDEALKLKKHEEFAKDRCPELLTKLAGLIEKNNGYIALGKLTWADFVLAGMIEYLKNMLQMPDLEEKYPAFKKVSETVYNLPGVREYIDNMPDREFPY